MIVRVLENLLINAIKYSPNNEEITFEAYSLVDDNDIPFVKIAMKDNGIGVEKDIASVTFQNSQSIDMARYRLRKKMALSQHDNLVDYLINL